MNRHAALLALAILATPTVAACQEPTTRQVCTSETTEYQWVWKADDAYNQVGDAGKSQIKVGSGAKYVYEQHSRCLKYQHQTKDSDGRWVPRS